MSKLSSAKSPAAPFAVVPGNDWRRLDVAAPEDFEPHRVVSVVVTYFEAPEALGLTLAALERQTYPRRLFEVVIVDDGSRTPLTAPTDCQLDVSVVHQEDLGFGLARARNSGAAAAKGEILVFLDCDMMPEAEWLAEHARWHHAAADVVTLGFRRHVEVDGITADAVRERRGTLGELFAGRDWERPEWIEGHMIRTDDLTSDADDIFRPVTGGNLGISKAFYATVGGYDETFTQWGAEDTEFGYRAYTRGALLVPARAALCWHQGEGAAPSSSEQHSLELQRAKISQLIAHRGFRKAAAGRSFTVPQFVVTISAGPADGPELLTMVENLLAGEVHDLVVWIDDTPDTGGHDREWLRRILGGDPRVRFGPAGGAAEGFGAASFHVTIPAGVKVSPDTVERLHQELGTATAARAELIDGRAVTIVRAWALHRSARTSADIGDLGRVLRIEPGAVKVSVPRPTGSSEDEHAERRRERRSLRKVVETNPVYQAVRRRVLKARSLTKRFLRVCFRIGQEISRINSAESARRFWRWAVTCCRNVVANRVRDRYGRLPRLRRRLREWLNVAEPAVDAPIEVKIAARGRHAEAVFAASREIDRREGRTSDVVLADDSDCVGAVDDGTAVVLLADLAESALVPAFDTEIFNPVDWRVDSGSPKALTGLLDRLRHGNLDHDRAAPERFLARWRRLRHAHHVKDIPERHRDALSRAAALTSLAATGAVVRLTDHATSPTGDPAAGDSGAVGSGAGDSGASDSSTQPELRRLLGAELYEAMTDPMIPGADRHQRELISIKTRRAALKGHSLRARVDQVVRAATRPGGADFTKGGFPVVSVLLATRRPERLAEAVAAVAAQTYPRVELVLAPHGGGFDPADVQHALEALPHQAKVVPVSERQPLGAVLNAATNASSGALVTKFDDDDYYSADHLWDLVLAWDYSGAQLVGKGSEYVYLGRSDCIVHRFEGRGERHINWGSLAGGAMLISRSHLDIVGGWAHVPSGVDKALIESVRRHRGAIYRTHGAGYVLVRHNDGHTWSAEDAYFLEQADQLCEGLDLRFAGITTAP